MDSRYSKYAHGILAVVLMMLAPFPAAAKEGFGATVFTKKTASLARVNPPKVYLMGTRIAVKAASQDSRNADVAQRIQSQLESELLSSDNRLTSDPSRPQTLIEVTVTQSEYDESWDTRRMTRRRQVGKDSKGKPVYEDYEVDVRFKTVKHHFTSTYKVTDVAQRRNLDSDSVQHNFEKSFQEGDGAPDQGGLENTAIQLLVSRVVHNLTPTREQVGVLLPKGSFESYINLAEANLWNKYLEALEALPPRPSPADDSYRKYGMGIAYEALGYSAETEETTLKYLEQAADYYNQAIETNPKEKYFTQAYDSIVSSKQASSPLERVRSALVSYRKLKEFKDNYAKAIALPAAGTADQATGGKALSGSEPGGMNNTSVIKMVRASLSEDIILTSINSAPKHSFDVSPDGLIALSDAGVGARIIQRIQEIASGKKTPAASKPATSKSAKPKGGTRPH
jgi:tetratricopeptide (TPR) repeat protein